MTATRTHTLPVDLGTGPFSLTTRGLTKRYGSVLALDGLDLRVPEHAVYVLVGPNGAGKSTLLRSVMGLVRPDSGDLHVLGLDPRLQGGEVRAAIGYVPEDHRLGYPWMTVGRLVRHWEAYHPKWDATYAAHLTAAYDIDPDRKCGALSKGEIRRVQLILALAHRPPLLLLDEPTDGLDHLVRDATLGILSEHLADSPTTVVISTHRIYEVEQLVDHVGLLAGGRLLGQMPSIELRTHLLRYWGDVPVGWNGSHDLDERVITRRAHGREIEWTVWGERGDVTDALTRSGAKVRDVTRLSLDEAAIALLSRQEGS